MSIAKFNENRLGNTLLLISVVFWWAWPTSLFAQVQHKVYLANTDHELHVYQVQGARPGKTLMIIGGIQGDEPSGYITADLYADIHLEQGNLIVIPRANFYSILLNSRNGRTGDMNRKFDAEDRKADSLEAEVVSVIKGFIAQSDCLLNLHEGSGFYNPVWISGMENPNRYGQSIIYDAETYSAPGLEEIDLGGIARRVAAKVNGRIGEQRHHFKVNNHDTLSKVTNHPEQRRSATYYALTRAGIPAFGIEISKTITSMESKIRLHKLVVNVMMEEFDILQDAAAVKLEEPRLDYLLVKVNGNHPYALQDGAVLQVAPGDHVMATDIVANYQRGLVADVVGMGGANDTNRSFKLSEPVRIMARKDSTIFGWVDLVPVAGATVNSGAKPGGRQGPGLADLKAESLSLDLNGEPATLTNNNTLAVEADGRLILRGIQTNIAMLDADVVVNFKGYVPPKSVNDGNDLHYPIYLAKDLWQRYSENNEGKRYPILATYDDKEIGTFWIELIK